MAEVHAHARSAKAAAVKYDRANAFQDWLADAAPGDRYEYHRGHLAKDMTAELRILADAVWRAASRERIELVQRRYGPDDYGYLAIRRAGR